MTNNNGWQPIETAPRGGAVVMGWFGFPWPMAWAGKSDGWKTLVVFDQKWCGMKLRTKVNIPTHWQPLPEPPEGDD